MSVHNPFRCVGMDRFKSPIWFAFCGHQKLPYLTLFSAFNRSEIQHSTRQHSRYTLEETPNRLPGFIFGAYRRDAHISRDDEIKVPPITYLATVLYLFDVYNSVRIAAVWKVCERHSSPLLIINTNKIVSVYAHKSPTYTFTGRKSKFK